MFLVRSLHLAMVLEETPKKAEFLFVKCPQARRGQKLGIIYVLAPVQKLLLQIWWPTPSWSDLHPGISTGMIDSSLWFSYFGDV